MAAKTRKARKKKKNNYSKGSENNQNGKGSANDQLQEDQRRSKIACEYCNNQTMSMWSQATSKKPPQSPIVKKNTCNEAVTFLNTLLLLWT